MKAESAPRTSLNETEKHTRGSIDQLPMFLAAKDLQKLGFSRSMAYQLMNRSDVPVLQIGERKFIPRDKFFAWVDKYSGGSQNDD